VRAYYDPNAPLQVAPSMVEDQARRQIISL
jgi:hypothetical protein